MATDLSRDGYYLIQSSRSRFVYRIETTTLRGLYSREGRELSIGHPEDGGYLFTPIGEVQGSSIWLDDGDQETMEWTGSRYEKDVTRLMELVDHDGKWLEYELVFSEDPPVPNDVTCQRCGHANPPGSQFCNQCGTATPWPSGEDSEVRGGSLVVQDSVVTGPMSVGGNAIQADHVHIGTLREAKRPVGPRNFARSDVSEPKAGSPGVRCETCGNTPEGEDHLLLCQRCGNGFCTTCEPWFRKTRSGDEEPLCKTCYHPAPKKTVVDSMSPKTGMGFITLRRGEFEMGDASLHYGRPQKRMNPVHRVVIERPFMIGKFPVMQKEWTAIMDYNPSKYQKPGHPVDNVTWDQCMEFINALNEAEQTDRYRLPTEAEWEYACRAGSRTKYAYGDHESQLNQFAWYRRTGGTRPAGKKRANDWQIHDMHGLVWEWCADDWHPTYENAPRDQRAWIDEHKTSDKDDSEHLKVQRGGSWAASAMKCTSATRRGAERLYCDGAIGFRLAAD